LVVPSYHYFSSSLALALAPSAERSLTAGSVILVLRGRTTQERRRRRRRTVPP
jgi:hypothetical protein